MREDTMANLRDPSTSGRRLSGANIEAAYGAVKVTQIMQVLRIQIFFRRRHPLTAVTNFC
jgi:hypothetical protein